MCTFQIYVLNFALKHETLCFTYVLLTFYLLIRPYYASKFTNLILNLF